MNVDDMLVPRIADMALRLADAHGGDVAGGEVWDWVLRSLRRPKRRPALANYVIGAQWQLMEAFEWFVSASMLPHEASVGSPPLVAPSVGLAGADERGRQPGHVRPWAMPPAGLAAGHSAEPCHSHARAASVP